MGKKRVLMICLGNICRSPIAEAVFANYIEKNGLTDEWEVDSAALIGYHTGKSPDHRTIATLREKGITNYSHRARPIKEADFNEFDWIFGMDNDNIAKLKMMQPSGSKAKVELLGSYDPEGQTIIRDPYYDNDRAEFIRNFEQCSRSIEVFIKKHGSTRLIMDNKKRVLMVCLGNTCRSPIAKAIFDDCITKFKVTEYWGVDSAGLEDWHVGETLNQRALMILRRNGIITSSHQARLIKLEDFKTFHWILAMDENNLSKLNQIKPKESHAVIELLGSYDPEGEIIIRDPYCDTDCTGFVKVYEQCERSIENFLKIHRQISLFEKNSGA